MKLRAAHLLFVWALFVCSTLVWSQSQDQNSQPTQPAIQEQPPQQSQSPKPTEPPPSGSAPDSTTTVTPSTNAPEAAPGSKAEATPKPPVLRRSKRKSVPKKTPKKSCGAQPGGAKKVVVKNGGEKDPSAQLAPAVNPDQARKERVSTEQLLEATGENLNRVAGRQLSQTEQNTVDKIHAYMRQAKAASASGDTNRAQTLAYKARQLSDDLARK